MTWHYIFFLNKLIKLKLSKNIKLYELLTIYWRIEILETGNSSPVQAYANGPGIKNTILKIKEKLNHNQMNLFKK